MAKIKGNKKNNKLKGTDNKDKIVGLGGDDSLDGRGGKDKLKAGGGDDQLDGGAGDDKLDGGKGNDLLDGGEGDDRLFGRAGDDVMRAGIGADHFDGGIGSDWVDYSASAAKVSVDLFDGSGLYGAAGDTFAFVENIIGTAFADSIVGNGGDNHFKGGGGVDSLDGRAGHNRLDGGDGNDLLHGSEGINAFIGGNGVDTASYSLATSGISVNLLTGNTNGAALGDTFSSIEKIVGTDFADVIQGNNSANSIYGRGGVDVLAGNGGNDVIDAGAGADIVNAGAGDDRVLAGEATAVSDHLIGGKGDDWIDYSGAAKGVVVNLTTGETGGHAEGDNLVDFENVLGSSKTDVLNAAAGGRVYGGDGDDIILDAAGTEVLRGGRGEDRLGDLTLNADTVTDIFFLEKGMGRDEINGFTQGVDLFWLSKDQFGDLDFNASGALANGQVANTAAPFATSAYAQLIFETDTDILWYDQDGIGGKAPVEIAVLNLYSGSLTKDDFVVVPDA